MPVVVEAEPETVPSLPEGQVEQVEAEPEAQGPIHPKVDQELPTRVEAVEAVERPNQMPPLQMAAQAAQASWLLNSK